MRVPEFEAPTLDEEAVIASSLSNDPDECIALRKKESSVWAESVCDEITTLAVRGA